MKCEMSFADNFDCSPTVLTKKSKIEYLLAHSTVTDFARFRG